MHKIICSSGSWVQNPWEPLIMGRYMKHVGGNPLLLASWCKDTMCAGALAIFKCSWQMRSTGFKGLSRTAEEARLLLTSLSRWVHQFYSLSFGLITGDAKGVPIVQATLSSSAICTKATLTAAWPKSSPKRRDQTFIQLCLLLCWRTFHVLTDTTLSPDMLREVGFFPLTTPGYLRHRVGLSITWGHPDKAAAK